MPIADFDLHGKVAFITGAGRGIGAGIAGALAEAGADVAVNALTMEHVGPLVDDIARTGVKAHAYAADATNPETIDRTVQAVLADFGRIDVLVNALGDSIAKALVPLPDRVSRDPTPLSDADLRKVLDINLTSAMLCARAVGPHLLERRSGKVINIGSYGGTRGGAGTIVYSTAKAALVGLTRALALEWAPYGIQVNMIAPGIFPDPVRATEETRRRLSERAERDVPLRRLGETREVGLLAVYLASSASDYMTGQTIHLDGGMTAV